MLPENYQTYYSRNAPGKFGVVNIPRPQILNCTYGRFCSTHLLTPLAYKFYYHESHPNEDLKFKFVFRGVEFFVVKNQIYTYNPTSFTCARHTYRAKKIKSYIVFPEPFDVGNLDHLVNAAMWMYAKYCPITRKGRDVDLDGLVYPPVLTDLYQPMRETEGETWDV